MVERPQIGVGVFIIRDGKILVGHRIGSHGSDTWSLPGGHLEFGETVTDCAKREVLEETGIQIAHVEHVDFTDDIYQAGDRHYVTLFVRAVWVNGEAERREPDRCAEWRWVEWPHIPEPHFLPVGSFLKTGINPFRT